VRAAIRYREGDDLNDPGHVEEIAHVEMEAIEPRREGQVQTKIMDFFQIKERQGGTNSMGYPQFHKRNLDLPPVVNKREVLDQ
jgi:hypothetical protein